jgi:hypothetical protein
MPDNLLPISIEDKENHPELVALVAAFGSKYFLSAEEFNAFRDGVNELYTVWIENAALVNPASALVRGILKLAGDFGGTADNPKLKFLTDFIDATATISRAVIISPQGALGVTTIMEYEFFDDGLDGYPTLASLQVNFPSQQGNIVRAQGFQVVCWNMANPTIYKKTGDSDENWMRSTNTSVSGWVKMV